MFKFDVEEFLTKNRSRRKVLNLEGNLKSQSHMQAYFHLIGIMSFLLDVKFKAFKAGPASE